MKQTIWKGSLPFPLPDGTVPLTQYGKSVGVVSNFRMEGGDVVADVVLCDPNADVFEVRAIADKLHRQHLEFLGFDF